MEYNEMTDQELTDIRKTMPKYLNDQSEEQKIISHAVYAEQTQRYKAAKSENYAEYNRQVEEAGYKVGDKVSYFARSYLGFGGVVITGTVQKRAKYYVKLIDRSVNGKKIAHLTRAWKKEEVTL